MKKRDRYMLALLLCCSSGLLAQEQTKGYMVTDPNGRGFYLIPECIAEKTVNAALSSPAMPDLPPPASKLEEGQFAVQVGSFAVPANAERLQRKLVRDGYSVMVSKVFFQRRNLTLQVVTVKALPTLEDAGRVLQAIKGSYGLDGRIVPPGSAVLASQ